MKLLFRQLFGPLVLVAHLLGGLGELKGQIPDSETLQQAGIRTIRSKHLTLYTDLPAAVEVDELPGVFDQAIPQWIRYFKAAPERLSDWHVTACVMRDSQRFKTYGLLPDDLPPFLHGLQRDNHVWVREQPSAYYRRHLLIHEGTHAVMYTIFGRVGPAWYREGIAELLATHRYEDGRVRLNAFPRNREEVRYWGRIKIIRDDISKRGIRSIGEIVDLPTRAFLASEAYAWTWGLQSFLSRHPRYAGSDEPLWQHLRRSDEWVSQAFLSDYRQNRAEMDFEWSVFLRHLDYGYDARFETVQYANVSRQLRKGDFQQVTVAADRAWQAAGVQIPAGAEVEIIADGRFQVAQEPSENDRPAIPWPCEPQGVTIEYYRGRPLGMLLAAVVPDVDSSDASAWKPVGVGRGRRITTKTGGKLFFRINERADRMVDNRGEIAVKIKRSL